MPKRAAHAIVRKMDIRRVADLRLKACALSLVFGGACTSAAPVISAEPRAVSPPHVAATTPRSAEPAVAREDPAPPKAAPTLDARFASDVKAAWSAYKAWGRVDDELRWAPFLCRLPNPGRPQRSKAESGEHAQKLYSLFAKERNAYVKQAKSPIGQIIVKESYLPELVTGHEPSRADVIGRDEGDHFDPYLRDGDKTYRAGALAGVYVMLRKPDATDGTDNGWIYGTLTASGEVTSAGRVESCMGCHASAKHERLFR